MRRGILTTACLLGLLGLLAAGCGGDDGTLEDIVAGEDAGDGATATTTGGTESGSSSTSGATVTTSAGTTDTAGSGDVFQLEVGQCFNDPSSTTNVADVPTVPCSEPHTNEVYDAFDIGGDVYPGVGAVEQQASDGCLERFEPFVGIAYEQSALFVSYLYPTQESWEQVGDREVICYLYEPEAQLTGSARGTAR